jgi:hypothetical protein
MKFRKIVDTEILDEDLLEMLNESLDWGDKPRISSLEGLTANDIVRIMGEDWFHDEFEYASDENSEIIIVK